MKLVWSPRAQQQLQAAFEHIAINDSAAAWRVRDRIVERAEQLQGFLELGPKGRLSGTRQLVITETPYVLVYRLRPDEVRIVAVWHSAQSRRRQ